MDAPQFTPYKIAVQRVAPKAAVDELLNGVRYPVLPEGMTFLVSAWDHLPFAPFLEFVSQKALRRSSREKRAKKSLLTIEAYAYDLSDFFWFLDAKKTRWEDVGLFVAEQYADTMIERPSPTTGRPYSDATITRRLSTLKTFYGWARDRGISRFSLRALEPAEQTKDRRRSSTDDVKRPPPVAPDREVRPISPEHLEKILAELGPLPSLVSLGNEAPNPPPAANRLRNRLMAECALEAGLRRAEVAGLRTSSVAALCVDLEGPFVMHPVKVVGKGSKERTVLLPGWLVEAIQTYISGPRAAVLEHKPDHGQVFVRHTATSSRGNSLEMKYLDKVFSAACVAAGFPHANAPKRAEHRFHDLRHTFALVTYFARKHNGDPEPWLYIQGLLGHEYLETTLKIYLRVARALHDEYSDRFHKVFKKLVSCHG